jgi:hypothetical protein
MRMKKFTIVVLLILLGLVLGYYLGYGHGSGRVATNTPVNQNLEVNFREPGILMRNDPGLPKPDTWFLKYDQEGKTGLLAEIVVNSNTLCEFNHQTNPCTSYPSTEGERVKAEGHLVNNLLTVTKFSELGLNDLDNSANVPLQKSETYGLYGTFTLTGYLKVEKRVCNPGDMCGETVDYASFVFDKSDNPNVYDMLTGGVGLGCYQKDKARIYSTNDADTGTVENTILGPDLAKLLASSVTHKVQLKLTKPIYTSGRGAPDCYSSFRSFRVL